METFLDKNGNFWNIMLKLGTKTNTTDMLMQQLLSKLVLAYFGDK